MLRMFSQMVAGGTVIAALVGCGGGGGAAHSEEASTASQYAGPITSTDTARGEEVYNQVCQACHAGGAPALAGIAWDVARMRQQIREGEGQMPAINESRVSNEDLEALLAYMVTINAVAGGDGASAGGETEDADAEGDAAAE